MLNEHTDQPSLSVPSKNESRRPMTLTGQPSDCSGHQHLALLLQCHKKEELVICDLILVLVGTEEPLEP